MARTVVGTPYYMSPELCRSEKYGFKSDMWALGCIVYELCALARPFDGANLSALVLQIVSSNPRPLHPTHAGPPQLHAAVLTGLLDKQPEVRPTARQLLRASWLQPWAQVVNDPLLTTLLAAAPGPAPLGSPALPPPPPSPRKPVGLKAPSAASKVSAGNAGQQRRFAMYTPAGVANKGGGKAGKSAAVKASKASVV